MATEKISTDELIQAIRWRLNLPIEEAEKRRAQAVWQLFSSDKVKYDALAPQICRALAGILAQAFACQLQLGTATGLSAEHRQALDPMLRNFQKWLKGAYDLRSKLVAQKIDDKLKVFLATATGARTNFGLQELEEAVLWKLQLIPESSAGRRANVWEAVRENLEASSYASQLCQALATILEKPLARRLGLRTGNFSNRDDFDSHAEDFWQHFLHWAQQSPKAAKTLMAQQIRAALSKEAPSGAGVQKKAAAAPVMAAKPKSHVNAMNEEETQPAGAGPPSQSEAPTSPATSAEPATEPAAPAAVASAWKYLSPPEGLDVHVEYAVDHKNSPEGFALIGARVRGKKHKHEGTHCDDWFHFETSGAWTIIAVSDGAGSKKFSRVGARASCQAAVNELAANLENHVIMARETLPQDLNRDPVTGAFGAEDLNLVQNALHKAMRTAYETVQREAATRSDRDEYTQFLGNRKLTLDDLSATLLLAVHTTVKYQEHDYSFILSCQVGDGMLAALHRNGKLMLLGIPDSGAFSGETDFLTSARKLEDENLRRKTMGFFGSLKALMVMTDGVADDYFPNDPGMLQLYGDLVLNQVLDLESPSNEELETILNDNNLPGLEAVRNLEFHYDSEALTREGPQKARIRSLTAFAEKLGIDPPEKICTIPELLIAGAQGEPLCSASAPEERLRVWLDSYYVKGSFDDRTLVVLYRKDLR